ncbi:MAG: hypothetical protein R2820_06475 [Cyclobacteriaceae bacterium]
MKTYRDEEGEYSDYRTTNLSDIKDLISSNWVNPDPPGYLEIISISNSNGLHLLLEHFAKNVFDVYLLTKDQKFHFHKRSYIEIAFDAVELFFDDKIEELQVRLNRTKKENSYIRGDFFFKDHNYRYTWERSIREVSWIWWSAGPFVLIVPMSLISTPNPSTMGFVMIFSLSITSLFVLPGISIHLNYKKDISNLIIRVTRGQDQMIIWRNGLEEKINKSEIQKITEFKNPSYRIPWSEYGYTELKLKDGRVINLSSLIVDQLFILDKFKYHDIETNTIDDWFPTIKNKTNI